MLHRHSTLLDRALLRGTLLCAGLLRASAACLAVTVLGALASGCADTDLGSKGLGEACTRTRQCGEELSCISGACTRPTAAHDAAQDDDAGADLVRDGGK